MNITEIITAAEQAGKSCGPLWARVDAAGTPIGGWRTEYNGRCGVRCLASAAADAGREWGLAPVGATVRIPAGYHPRHGAKWETWKRIR